MSTLIKLDLAAEILTISRRSIDRLIAAGKLHLYRPSPGRCAVDKEEVEIYKAGKKEWVSDTTIKVKVTLSESGDEELQLLELLKGNRTPKRSTQKSCKKSVSK